MGSAPSLTRLRRFVAAAAPARLWLSRSRWLRREGAEPGAAAAAASLQVPPGGCLQPVSRSLLSGELRSNPAAQDVTSASRRAAEDGRRPCEPEAPKGRRNHRHVQGGNAHGQPSSRGAGAARDLSVFSPFSLGKEAAGLHRPSRLRVAVCILPFRRTVFKIRRMKISYLPQSLNPAQEKQVSACGSPPK